MSVNINVTLTITLNTFLAVRDAAHPEDSERIVDRVANDTVYQIIDALKGKSHAHPAANAHQHSQPNFDISAVATSLPHLGRYPTHAPTISDYSDAHAYDIKLESDCGMDINPGELIRVKVMKLSDGEYLHFNIMSNAPARELACLIHDEYGMPLLKQILMVQGIVIFRRGFAESIDLSLDQVGVFDGSKITLGERL